MKNILAANIISTTGLIGVLNKLTSILLLGVLSLFLSACGMTSRISKPGTITVKPGTRAVAVGSKKGEIIEDGVASWYGPNFHGKLTANGEKYDMYALTAAHRTLPFNTIVRVYNLDNGKSVNVRINDRGPFAKDRIIDLSKTAAQKIDMLGPGTAPVQLYLIEGDLAGSKTTNLKVATYTVQLGSFKTEERALKESLKIKGSRVEKISTGNDTVYRVYYGVYVDTEEARKKQLELSRNGFNGYVKQIQN